METTAPDDGSKPSSDEKKVDEDPRKNSEIIDQEKDDSVNSTNNVNAASTNKVNVVGRKTSIELPDDPNMPVLEDIVYSDDDEDVGAEADILKRRVKRLEKKGGLRTHKIKRLYKVGLSRRVESSKDEGLGEEDASKQGRIADIDTDAGINLVSTHFDADTYMFGVHDLVGDEVVVETEVTSKDVNLSVDKVTLAQALAALKSAKPKADKVMLQELEQGIITTTIVATIVTAASTRPRAKGLIIHEQEQAPTSTVSSQQPSQLNVQDKV
ncbi:hypothetical protein Tco_1564878, partial [Tanacetum coccineum]